MKIISREDLKAKLDWQEAGYPLEGRDVLESPSSAGEHHHGHLMMSFA